MKNQPLTLYESGRLNTHLVDRTLDLSLCGHQLSGWKATTRDISEAKCKNCLKIVELMESAGIPTFSEYLDSLHRTKSIYKISWAKEKRQRARIELVTRYGGCCACCGVTDYRWLTLHHINSDGGIERKHQQVNAANRLYHLLAQPKRDDLELLCYNCHLAHDFFGLCPHRDPDSAYFLW